MTLTIELTSEEEVRLRDVAARQGVEMTEYARRLLGLEARPSKIAPLTEAEWDELEAELVEGIDPTLPPLSEETLSRASIYGDRA